MGQVMTDHQKGVLHEMLYYKLATPLARGSSFNAIRCYYAAWQRANWILAAIGEHIDEDAI